MACASNSPPPAARVSNATLMSNGAIHGLRASFEIDPNDADLIELHLRVMRGDHAGHRNLALPMDRRLNSAVAYQPVGASGGMPPESPLEMPPQDLRYKPSRRARDRPTPAVLFARFILVTDDARRRPVRRLSDAAGGALRQHDAAAGSDDFLLRRLAGLDRIRSGLGDCRCIEAPRSHTGPGTLGER
jgi:hypothetical protein